MPSKKKKYNARFPAGRIKKIMQTDEEVGKVAQAVPVIISRTLELFVESLLTKTINITQARNAKTLTPSHMKQCILSESRFDFLKDLVKDIPDASTQDDNENNTNEAIDYTLPRIDSSPQDDHNEAQKSIVANFYTEQSTSAGRTPVIQYGPKVTQTGPTKLNFSVENLVQPTEPKVHIDLSAKPQIPVPELTSFSNKDASPNSQKELSNDNVPSLIPVTHNYYGQTTGDNLYIDEDYDN